MLCYLGCWRSQREVTGAEIAPQCISRSEILNDKVLQIFPVSGTQTSFSTTVLLQAVAEGHPADDANRCVILEHLILFYPSVATRALKCHTTNASKSSRKEWSIESHLSYLLVSLFPLVPLLRFLHLYTDNLETFLGDLWISAFLPLFHFLSFSLNVLSAVFFFSVDLASSVSSLQFFSSVVQVFTSAAPSSLVVSVPAKP